MEKNKSHRGGSCCSFHREEKHARKGYSNLCSMVQHTVLPSSGKIDVMTEVDQMVMFCLMTRRRINLVRLIMDFIVAAVNVEKKRHATLPYGMFLTRVFVRA